jgi:hypothetical protein
MRAAIVRTRSKYISLVRALMRRGGRRVAAVTARGFAVRLERLPLAAELRAEVTPLVTLLEVHPVDVGRLNPRRARQQLRVPLRSRLVPASVARPDPDRLCR